MSNKSLIKLTAGDEVIAAIGTRWSASTYGIAEQVELVAKVKETIKNDNPYEWINAIVDFIDDNTANIYRVKNEDIESYEKDCCWVLSLNLLSDTFSIFDVMDFGDKMDLLEGEENMDIGDYSELEQYKTLTWQQLTCLTDIVEHLNNKHPYYNDKVDENYIYFFSIG